jgi:hypothetical protein
LTARIRSTAESARWIATCLPRCWFVASTLWRKKDVTAVITTPTREIATSTSMRVTPSSVAAR